MTQIKKAIWGAGAIAMALGGYWLWTGGKEPLPPTRDVTSDTQRVAPTIAQASEVAVAPPEAAAVQSETSLGFPTGIEPTRPVWQILEEYAKQPQSKDLQDEVLAGLSFCSTGQGLDKVLQNLKSTGGVTPQTEAIAKVIEVHEKKCVRLSSADYVIRLNIVRERAQAGDVNAMFDFVSLGPDGHWGAEGTQTLRNPLVQAWQREAIGFLELAAKNGQTAALATLASLYGRPPSPERADEPFSDVYDPAKSYAYKVAWHYAMGRDEESRKRLLDSGYLKNAEIGLTAAQIQSGKNESKSIIGSIGRKNL
jgi:hypothetical protein